MSNSLRADSGNNQAIGDPTQMPMSTLIANGDRSRDRSNDRSNTSPNSPIIFPDADDVLLPHNRTLPVLAETVSTNTRSESTRASPEATEGNRDTSVLGSTSVEPSSSTTSAASLSTASTLNPSDSSLHSLPSSSPSSAFPFSSPSTPSFAATTPGPNSVVDPSRPDRDPRYNPTIGGSADLIEPIDLTNPNSASGSSGRPSGADEHGSYPGSNSNNYPTNSGNRPSSGNYPGNYPGNSNVGTNPYPSGSGTRQPGNTNNPSETGSGYPGSGSNYPGSGSGYPGSGSNYPGSGSNYPGSGSGSSYPGSGSGYPGSGSNYPGSGSGYPGNNQPGYNRPGGYGNNYGKKEIH